MNHELVLSVSDFVELLNQTLEYAYPTVIVEGEIANFRISKNRWVYFDLKDETASVKFFGTVYQLPGPLEEGMVLRIRGLPRLHPQYGFSITIQIIQPVGEGTIRRAAQLLESKLAAEGLFDEARKRRLPYPPVSVGLVTSSESAAYADFMKVLRARWTGLDIKLVDVQVQGEAAIGQIVAAVEHFNQMAEPPEVLVLTRGGGSPEDLAAFSSEQVTRAVAASRIPTLLAVGHEIDISLAELAADRRASTPSNAAELLVPDKQQVAMQLRSSAQQLSQLLSWQVATARQGLVLQTHRLHQAIISTFTSHQQILKNRQRLLGVLDPHAPLKRGYAIVRKGDMVVRSRQQVQAGDTLQISLQDGEIMAQASKPGVK